MIKRLGAGSKDSIREILRSQRRQLLEKVKEAQREIRRQKSEHEKAQLEKAKAIGKCPMDFDVRATSALNRDLLPLSLLTV